MNVGGGVRRLLGLGQRGVGPLELLGRLAVGGGGPLVTLPGGFQCALGTVLLAPGLTLGGLGRLARLLAFARAPAFVGLVRFARLLGSRLAARPARRFRGGPAGR